MRKLSLLTLGICLVTPLSVKAQDEKDSTVDELIDKVVKAYGGDAISQLRNYEIQEQYLAPAIGQSHSAELTEVNKSIVNLMVDISNNRSSIDRWDENRGGAFQGTTVSDGDKAFNINYQNQTFGKAGNADPHIFAGGTMRTAPSVLVYELNKVRDKASLGEDTQYLSRPHHVITMPFPQSPDLNLYVDATTFLISKMIRVNPNLGDLTYVFSDYKKNNGIRYAGSTQFFIAGEPNLISNKRSVRFNQDIKPEHAKARFTVPANFKPEAERVDASTMNANKLSERSYHVGANGAFTLFVNTTAGTVAAGGYAGLESRLREYRRSSDNHKPLTYQVVTHHHSDHIGGIGDAIRLGAKVVTVDDNIDAISESITPRPEAQAFYSIGKRATFGDGRARVEVYEVSTIHAQSFLVTYVPADKLVFIADHYGSPFTSGTPTANKNSVDMLTALEDLDIDIKRISTAHNARIFTMKELRDSVAAYMPTQCLGQRPVCG